MVAGLRAVTVSHAGPLAAEGRVMLEWLRRRLAACGAAADGVAFATTALADGQAGGLAAGFEYAERARFFRWSGDLKTGNALFEADFGAGRTRLPAAVSLLVPENALSEAMFF
jgi:hypothetical protein